MNCVYVDTNLDTHLVVLLHDHETISDFKEKLRKEHHQCFPELGEIDISAVKVKRQNTLGVLLDYHLPDSICLSMAFEGISHDCWFVFVDATVRIVEKGKEIASGSLLLDGYTKNQSHEEDLETEKTTKKRKIKTSEGEKSRKKPKVNPNQSSKFDVVESPESSPREKLDETLTEATGKEIEMGKGSVEDAGRDKTETVNPTDTNSVLTARPDTEKKKGRKKRSKDDISQSAADIVNEINTVPTNVDPVDATPESLPISRVENLDVPFAEASQKENETGEISFDDVGRDKTDTANLANHTANHLDTNSDLTATPDTETKKRRKKRSKDDNQPSSAALTTSRDIMNEINGVPANVDPIDDTPESLAREESLDKPESLTEASQKENETDNPANHTANHLHTNSELTARPDTETKKRRKKRSKDDTNQSSAAALTTSRDIINEINGVPANVDSVDATLLSLPIPRAQNLAEANQKDIDDVGRDQSETANLASHTADHLDTNIELTTRPDTEKKKRRNKSSKDDMNLSSSAITTSRDIVNEINEVPANVDPVGATPESLPISRGTPFAESSQKENEMAGKSVEEDVGRDNIETNSGLTTRPDTEKKKRRKKSSNDDVNQSVAAITASGDIMNEINGVPGNEDPVDATLESLSISRRENLGIASQKETETGEKNDDIVGGGKAIQSAVDNIQPSNVDMDADETKSLKSTKKRKSKKGKTPAEEDALVVASDAHNVEPIKAVDGEEPDNVIRNILDSLQEKNETEENLEKTGKKTSKQSKKKHSLKVAESQVLSIEVNNAALEETPPIDNTKDTNASFLTPTKKDTDSDASLLKKISDDSLSNKILVKKPDMGDNFGCSQKDQVAGGAKSKKEKKGLHLHPSGSTNGSLLSSMQPKEKKSRAQQPASSGTHRLQSRVQNDRRESVRAAGVKSKKEDVKKTSSKPLTVNKRKTNFFEAAEKCNSSEDEYKKMSDVSTKTPSDYSSDGDSDVTSMSRKQGNNLAGGANKFSGSLQDILRRSSSYKKALIRAQSQPDIDDDSPVDLVPDSQGILKF